MTAFADKNSEAFPFVIHETPEWLVIGKPAGWLTIPGRSASGNEPVVSQWLEGKLQRKLWVVHRLDRETSGVLLFAKSAEAHKKANSWFQEHRVKKTYHFLAAGSPPKPIFKVRSEIEGALSTTQFEVRERFPGCFQGFAFPVTGRRHQIRIHLAESGFPILGDSAYGGPKEILGSSIGRVALHAACLELPTREKWEAPWPEDFQSWIEAFRSCAK